MANTLNLFRNGAVGFIDWLDGVRPLVFSPCVKDLCSRRVKTKASNDEISNGASPEIHWVSSAIYKLFCAEVVNPEQTATCNPVRRENEHPNAQYGQN